MNRKTVLAGSALLLAMALSTPRAWAHGADPRMAAGQAAAAQLAADGAAPEQCTGPSSKLTATPRARPGCVAQPG